MLEGSFMKEILVTYFSAEGTTKRKAEEIAEILNADIVEIAPLVKYTSEDLNWRNRLSRSSIEMQDERCRPQIKKINLQISDYKTVLIGYPIWWGVEPREVDTFLDTYDLSKCKIVLFATSGGSPINESVKHIKTSYPSLNIVSSYLANFNLDKKEIEDLFK